ncbi:MAG TPA: aldo/keto reductase [Thermoleophilaceae bacterium]
MARLGSTGLDVFPLCLGGNVFGWTTDDEQSFAVLDAYVAAGGNFIDSADSYSAFAPGNVGGESEAVIGKWLSSRGNRGQVIVATKVGKKPDRQLLAPDNIRAAVDESLARLQTDYIDLYYAHLDDPDTPLEDTLATFDELVREGKVRHIGASNYEAPRLAEALAVSDREGLARYAVVQPHYSLVARSEYEGELQDLCLSEGLAVIPYWGLAKGFLTGKYRPGGDQVRSPRAGQAGVYLEDERNVELLDVLDEVAAAHGASSAAVALAWLTAQPGVVSALASATSPAQLAESLAMVELTLTDAELERLADASAQTAPAS